MTTWLTCGLGLSLFLGAGLCFAEEGMVARIGQSDDVLEFVQRGNGPIVKYHLPLNRAGEVRYFSAGVGLEERQAEYPPFSLKLVFTAGGKPFLTGVDVTIQPANGGAAITISRKQVEGPWLFVDLPSGIYDVSATYVDSRQELKGIKVEAGKQKTVHLRWAKERGLTEKVPVE